MNHIRVSNLESIASIVQSLDFQKNSLALCLYLAQNWTVILGEELSKVLRPVRYKNHCLWIQLPSSCHIQEMNFQKQSVISKINHTIGKPLIQNIRWIL